MKHATTLIWASIVFLSAAASSAGLSAQTVVVRLRNGREMSATIHDRTDNDRLWLQYGTRAVTVIRPIDWQMIVGVWHDGQKISIGQLKAVASTVSAGSVEAAPPRILRVPPADELLQRETMANRARQALGSSSPVSSVQFDAVLANWDADVETDGLLLRLFPFDAQGNVAPGTGTLRVEFVGRSQRDSTSARHHGGSMVGTIGRWTAQVDEADFRQGVATVKLPFGAIHPEFDTDWFAEGLVHISFSVAGDGTFEQSLDGIRTRPFSPLRDAMQRQSDRRFLPSERTGRGKRANASR